MPLPTRLIRKGGQKAIDHFLVETVSSKRVPATFLGVATAKDEIYYNQAGERSFGHPDNGQVDENTILQLYSCTKLVTAIACFQLIDQGKISLHDPDTVAKHLPELGDLSILEGYDEAGREILRKPETKITLNMLLTHTSGLSYTFKSPLIARWSKEHNIPSMFSANPPLSAFLHPLLFEPGTQFGYSVGYDWAGFLVSRVTGSSLEDYFQEHIFRPCGITSISFFPPDDYASSGKVAGRGMEMHVRSESDREKMHKGEHPMWRTLIPTEIGPNFVGGAGLFGTARDYLRFLRAVLASADPGTSNALISPSSFKMLFTDAVPPQQQSEIRAELATMAKRQDVNDPAWYADGKGESLGYSPGLFLNFADSTFGRSAGSGCWYGAARTMFWLDPSKGVAAICFTNLIADNPDPWNKVYNVFERLVYDHLEDGGSA